MAQHKNAPKNNTLEIPVSSPKGDSNIYRLNKERTVGRKKTIRGSTEQSDDSDTPRDVVERGTQFSSEAFSRELRLDLH